MVSSGVQGKLLCLIIYKNVYDFVFVTWANEKVYGWSGLSLAILSLNWLYGQDTHLKLSLLEGANATFW